MNAKIVVDLGFGDSGKGLVVDTLCVEASKPLVVRYTGGPQAGHTVVNEEGIRHVHSSFGSGTLRGVPSYFSEHTLISLAHMAKELKVFSELGVSPTLFVHPHAALITPWDIIWGRMREEKLGHGSCGAGVGAAMYRQTNTPYKIFVADLTHPVALEYKLKIIWAWYQEQAKKFDFDFPKFNSDHPECVAFKEGRQNRMFQIISLDCLVHDHTDLIFEGAQGILLDQDHGFFPHVTYGKTTCVNAIEILSRLPYHHNVEMEYVTRCYQTRHGNGPVSTTAQVDLINNEAETNVTNKWQGDFVCVELDPVQLAYALEVDHGYHKGLVDKINMTMTCIDQRMDFDSEMAMFWDFDQVYLNGNPRTGHRKKL